MRYDCFHFQYLLFYEPLSLFLQHSRKINTKTIMSVACGCKTYRSTRISKVIYCPYNWGKVYYALSFNFIFFPLSCISQATPRDMRITLQCLFVSLNSLEALYSFVQWNDPEERQFACGIIFIMCYHYYTTVQTLCWHRVTPVLEYSRVL